MVDTTDVRYSCVTTHAAAISSLQFTHMLKVDTDTTLDIETLQIVAFFLPLVCRFKGTWI